MTKKKPFGSGRGSKVRQPELEHVGSDTAERMFDIFTPTEIAETLRTQKRNKTQKARDPVYRNAYKHNKAAMRYLSQISNKAIVAQRRATIRRIPKNMKTSKVRNPTKKRS